jgi:hypothetical protein
MENLLKHLVMGLFHPKALISSLGNGIVVLNIKAATADAWIPSGKILNV